MSCERYVVGDVEDPIVAVCLRDGGTKLYGLTCCGTKFVGLEESFPEILDARAHRALYASAPRITYRRHPITVGEVRQEETVPCAP